MPVMQVHEEQQQDMSESVVLSYFSFLDPTKNVIYLSMLEMNTFEFANHF